MDFSTKLQSLLNWSYTPKSEFYWPYIVTGLFVTIAFLMFKFRLSLRASLQELFKAKVWRHKSTKLDFIVSMFYAFVWYAPSAWVSEWAFQNAYVPLTNDLLPKSDGVFASQFPQWALQLTITLWAMICIDFASYVTHRAMHTWHWLWSLHSVHHATEHLNIFSTHRQHPLAPIILNLTRGLFAGAGFAVFDAAVPGNQSPLLLLGMNAGFFIYMLSINLHHLHIPVSYPKWTRWLLISPHIHHIHHSKAERHYNKNFGVVFSFWDRMFGTYHDEDLALGQLEFGIHNDPYQHRLGASLWKPIVAMFQRPEIEVDRVVVPDDRSLPASKKPNGSAMKVLSLFALVGGVFFTDTLQSSNLVTVVSIVDEQCELTHVSEQNGKRSIESVKLDLSKPVKPFVCTRQAGQSFSCYSNNRKQYYQFQSKFESSQKLVLESNDGRYAMIDVDKQKSTFEVVATFRNEGGKLFTENCYGKATLSP